MTKFLSRIRFAAGASALLRSVLLFGFLLACVVPAPPASAQQRRADTLVNPTASSVKEQELLREMRIISGRGSIPDVKSYNIEQPAGREWRQFHEITLHWLGAIAILGMPALLVLFYLIRGMVRLESGRSWRTIVRFNMFERLVHWMTATCFVVLALSGLNITFGKDLIMPLVGEEAFATWSQWAKYAHDYLSFPFTLGVAAILLMWVASGRRAVRGEASAGPAFQRGAEDDLLDRRHRRRRRRDKRLSLDVPVLPDRHRRYAISPNDPRGGRNAVRRRHAGSHLYRHNRDGGRLRSDVERHS